MQRVGACAEGTVQGGVSDVSHATTFWTLPELKLAVQKVHAQMSEGLSVKESKKVRDIEEPPVRNAVKTAQASVDESFALKFLLVVQKRDCCAVNAGADGPGPCEGRRDREGIGHCRCEVRNAGADG